MGKRSARRPPRTNSTSTNNQSVAPPAPVAAPSGDHADDAYEPHFPVVGIGASAGGLEACSQLLRELPAKPGMAFVLVQHLAPAHESALAEIIARVSKLPVHQVKDGVAVEPDHFYVIPPNKDLVITRGRLQLGPREDIHGQSLPIDRFLRSLARDQGSRAIGVILSGNASDGALGIEAVKAEGGITFAQDEGSAKYSGMPHSAVATGCVDFVLPPEGIAAELTRIGRHPYVAAPKEVPTAQLLPDQEDSLAKVFQILRVATGIDFTYYKSSTVHRRINRRMAVNKIEDIAHYLRYLRETPVEVQALHRELLVPVTSFFREPEVFEALKQHVFPTLMQQRAPEESLRIWVPGCSTGEEVYSMAICLLEFLGEMAATTPLQIFATDVSQPALDKARAGVYTQNIALDVSPERLRRFFVKVERGYQVSKAIRDLCICARQDITKDPPFSKLDLISCRNVFIYLEPLLHKKIIPIFHYALKPHGFLLLGAAETTGAFGELFALADRKHKVYARRATVARPHLDVALGRQASEEPGKVDLPKRTGGEIVSDLDVQREVDRLILVQYAPPGVLVNDQLEILQFRGDTSPYLAPAPGRASFNLFKMAREGLLVELRAATAQARKRGSPVVKERVSVRYRGGLHEVNVKVVPIKVALAPEPYLLILFEEVTRAVTMPPREARAAQAQAQSAKNRNVHRHIARLEQELAAARETMEATIQEAEASNEELKAANEEALSSNEELQTTNEELQTAKEELQSNNEELTTVNEQLQTRNAEMSQLTDDLSNLLSSVNLPIVMLGSDMRIRRFTPMAEKVLGLIAADNGRPVRDLRLNLQVSDLEQKLIQVVDAVAPLEEEVRDRDGHWYSIRMRPYRTQDNKIDGVVLTLIDIDPLKRSLEDLRKAVEQIQDLYDSAPCGYHSLNKDGLFVQMNDTELSWLGFARDEVVGKMHAADLLTAKSRGIFHEKLERLKQQGWVRSVELEFVRKNGTVLPALVNATAIKDEDGKFVMSRSTVFDISERKRAEEQQILISRELEMLLHVISHDLKEPLRAIESFSSVVHDQYAQRLDEKGQDLLQRTVKATARMRLLLDDTMALSRVRSMGQPTEEVEGEALVREALDRLKVTIESTRPTIQVATGLPRLRVDRTWAAQAIYNLLANALKFTREGEAPDVEVARYQPGPNDPPGAGIVVRDRGPGVAPENSERIFELFQRAVGREVEGTGAGLAIVLEVAKRHGGRAWVRPREGGGSEFIITFGAENPSEGGP